MLGWLALVDHSQDELLRLWVRRVGPAPDEVVALGRAEVLLGKRVRRILGHRWVHRVPPTPAAHARARGLAGHRLRAAAAAAAARGVVAERDWPALDLAAEPLDELLDCGPVPAAFRRKR